MPKHSQLPSFTLTVSAYTTCHSPASQPLGSLLVSFILGNQSEVFWLFWGRRREHKRGIQVLPRWPWTHCYPGCSGALCLPFWFWSPRLSGLPFLSMFSRLIYVSQNMVVHTTQLLGGGSKIWRSKSFSATYKFEISLSYMRPCLKTAAITKRLTCVSALGFYCIKTVL